jgi:integrase
MLVSNPTADIELPKSVRRELNVLTPEQAQAFLKAAYEGNHGVMFDLAINAGLRPEELLGLKWSHMVADTSSQLW